MGTKYEGTADERRALDTYIKLTRASDTMMARINNHLEDYDLTTSQFGAMEALYHLGTLSQVMLAQKILKSTGNVTTVLQNLEKRGLIERERDPADQRVVLVTLSAAGRTLIARILPPHVAGVVAQFSVLSAEEQETLAALCRKLGLGNQER